jgi:hypothetical protein
MGAFLENPTFFFMDDMEPILPAFRSSINYNDSGRIVELADVGCDTDAAFPIHSPRGVFDRRRGGAENAGLTRRTAKWHNGRSKNLSRIPASPDEVEMSARDRKRIWDLGSTPESSFDRSQARSRNYIAGNLRRDESNYDDVYIADLDYDAENSYDELDVSRNSSEYMDDYYDKFARMQNTIGRSRKERDVRYPYSRNLKSPPWDPRAYDQNILSRNLDSDERSFHEAYGTDARSRRSLSNEDRKRVNVLRRPDRDRYHKSDSNRKD